MSPHDYGPALNKNGKLLINLCRNFDSLNLLERRPPPRPQISATALSIFILGYVKLPYIGKIRRKSIANSKFQNKGKKKAASLICVVYD